MTGAELVALLDRASIPYCRVVSEDGGQVVIDTEDREVTRERNRGRVAAAARVLARAGAATRTGFRVTVRLSD